MKHILALTTAFARPANTTAYASGDIVANNVTAGNVVVPSTEVSIFPGRGGRVTRVGLAKSSVTVADANFRVHLFQGAAPVVTSGDNAAMAIAGNAAGYIGSIDVATDKAFSDGAAGDSTAALPFALPAAGKKLYAVIEARGPYVPASGETFTVRLGIERD